MANTSSIEPKQTVNTTYATSATTPVVDGAAAILVATVIKAAQSE
jgi:hypothetical protein